MFDSIDQLAVNSVRTLSLDAIDKAQSGHPGLPMGAAPMAYALWTRNMTVNPKDSHWFNRDRFVLSAGHGSAMLYSLLHLSGYQVSITDLKHFRQMGSKTPGHPEYGWTDGVEATTGPLGQGLGMSVGMAMAERHLGAMYNRPGFKVVDHYTYTLVGDGDLMEGISHEAASLAGRLRLGKLIVLYDSNDVSLDGPLSNAFAENIQERFESYGWSYRRVDDGNDLNSIDKAIKTAQMDQTKPTIIEVKTTIGYGAPKQGTHAVHGAPLSAADLRVAKENYQWPYAPFYVPGEVYDRFYRTIQRRGHKAEEDWNHMMESYATQYPELAAYFADDVRQMKSVDLSDLTDQYELGDAEATRLTSAKVLQTLSKREHSLWGGSADLFSSNKTNIKDNGRFDVDSAVNRNLWFGVREFAEGCAMNGIALHGGSRVYGSTFMVFSDYMRGAMRLAALQKLPVTYVFTHDSVAVGEDGPTHEPIEQLASMRAMPGLSVIRPADANETIAAWQQAMGAHDHPTVLIMTRQTLPVLTGAKAHPEGVSRGAYVISAQKGLKPDGILIASGSEVQLALTAQQKLWERSEDVSVVSMPSMDLFDAQPQDYKDEVLPRDVRNRVSIEMGSTSDWGKYVGLDGKVIGIDTFGLSGKGSEVIKHFGFTPETVVDTYASLINTRLHTLNENVSAR
ncbi:Transketolase [Furfurilactobacillus rossiae]|uniref:transketolase n=1 Tax=Furfurilactobacillus rossiae TaxID=231049 RepID=UPI0015B945B7|nr:transketolase [Furfurilactobacillus rossiae]MCF6164546.1 transketolase [Furfurilactobacillus rossiae]QLE64829.1 Transketolase [Furfurilactobacillus rossiae]